jgi:hypothetical protein
MKRSYILIAAALTIIAVSCKKDHPDTGGSHNTPPARKVRYELFTKEDFSDDSLDITFTLFMEDRNTDIRIFDSALATMKISEIPDSLHKIVVEKLVPGNDTATLVVGFDYYIHNVGYSWYLDTFPSLDTLKLLRYSFR